MDRAAPLMTIDAINRFESGALAARLGGACERSPWIVERAMALRPFDDRIALHAAIVATIRRASRDEQLALLEAHPDLAGAAAQRGELTAESQREQRGAGLSTLDADRAARIADLNRRYRERFGFPFIVCARLNVRDAILGTFEARILNEPAMEFDNAIAQIGEIVRLRLADLVA